MIKESQEKYLATKPDGLFVEIKPFNPKAREVGLSLVSELKSLVPNLQIHFGGATMLEISGQNDIDIIILTTPQEYDTHEPIISKTYGLPTKKGTSSITWNFLREGFEVDLHLSNIDSVSVQEQIKVFKLMEKSENLRNEYEKIKLPYGKIDYKEYMRKKYAFFNKILELN